MGMQLGITFRDQSCSWLTRGDPPFWSAIPVR
jgi:hypothetical protein